MKALVTGGAGFVGSWLVRELLQRGDEVLILDDLSTGRYENIEDVDDGKKLRLVVDTVNDPTIVNDCVKAVDVVYHLASAVGVRLIIDQPVRTIESIVGGTECVLKACARYRRPVLLTSTSEVYGKGAKIPFSEDDDRVMGATTMRRWSYACAKALDEFLALAHWHESRMPVVIARLFNTVGPRQTGQYGMVVPTFVRQALLNKPVTVYGNGKQSRCFAHVADIVRGLADLLAEPACRGQIFNLGNNEEVTIYELGRRIVELTGSSSSIEMISYEEAYGEGFDDMQRRVPDLAKAGKAIGYHPSYGLDAILTDVARHEAAALGLPLPPERE